MRLRPRRDPAIAVEAGGKIEIESCLQGSWQRLPAYGNADAITQEELKNYLYFIASDQLEGRNLPSRGFDIAALYVASHLAEWGLKPGGSQTGTNGPLQPYLMPFELVTKSVIPDQTKISLTAPGGGNGGGRGGRGGGGGNGGGGRGRNGGGDANAAGPRSTDFEYQKDWTLGGGGRGGGSLDNLDVTGKLVFAGNGYLIKKGNIDPYQGIDVKGKIIVVAGLPAELAAQQAAAAARGGRGGGGRGPDPLGEACTDYWSPEQYAAKNGAIAVVTIPNFQQLTAQANPNGGAGGRGGGTQRSRLSGPEIPGEFDLPRGPRDQRRSVAHQRDFPGREIERIGRLLRSGSEHQAGFLRSVRGKNAQASHQCEERIEPRGKRGRHSRRRRSGQEE